MGQFGSQGVMTAWQDLLSPDLQLEKEDAEEGGEKVNSQLSARSVG